GDRGPRGARRAPAAQPGGPPRPGADPSGRGRPRGRRGGGGSPEPPRAGDGANCRAGRRVTTDVRGERLRGPRGARPPADGPRAAAHVRAGALRWRTERNRFTDFRRTGGGDGTDGGHAEAGGTVVVGVTGGAAAHRIRRGHP